MIIKTESNMDFQFEEKYYYSLEEDQFYNRITSKFGAKVCDFITLRGESLLFIEAKSSAPLNSDDLKKYTQDIYQKYLDSILLYTATIHNRKNTISNTLTSEMKKTVNLKKDIKLVLIINGFSKKNLQELKNVFIKLLRKLNYMFSISSFVLMNDEQARSKGLIT